MNGKFLPENETVEFEDRLYLNPNTSLQEQTDFISNLRNIQNANNAEINAQTYNLGTAVPSSLGGLVGGEGYFTSRFQTPQSTSLAANLRATAQAKALNEVLSNELAMQKQRYNKAYKAAQKRANTPTTPTTDPTKGEVEKKVITPEKFYGVPDAIKSETDTHYIYTDPKTGEQTKVSKDYMNQIYDKNGNITDDGAVILDTRRLLGL